ncbi:minor tail protein [Mycobacterium phage Dumbo]|uniref:Head-to-tail connector protein n=1 Tax=Mycobacterium Phage BigBubba TaxID=3158890 RepID=A0AAU8GN30_9CAUD|nr:minor tail protein [Mycobacterium phage Dumbo]AGM12757.1 hypothetical protein PBI_DUMBO_16 [Mycobacterium phage Dumbo]WRQ08825.1 hypothetical protein JDBV04_00120 [Mycobacterium phage mushipu]
MKGLGNLISKAEINAAIASSPAVHAGLIAKAKEVQEYWVEYWNSIPHPHSRTHTLKSGYVENPGDYAKSIRVSFVKSKSGLPKARVMATDYKSWWIEYGAKHMPEFAPRAHTLAHFEGGGATTVSA